MCSWRVRRSCSPYLNAPSHPVLALAPQLGLAARCYHPVVLDYCVEGAAAPTGRRDRVEESSTGLRRRGRGAVAVVASSGHSLDRLGLLAAVGGSS
jgi:hypothetical protein